MPTFTWTQYPVTEFDTKYHCGDPIPAINDLGFLYREVDNADVTDPDYNGSYSMEYCDVDTGSALFRAWHRLDRSATQCFECDQLMTIGQFMQLPFCGDGSTLDYPILPPIPDPGPPP